MKAEIKAYFEQKRNKHIRCVFVTADGTFFPEKNKQEAVNYQVHTLGKKEEDLKMVENPANKEDLKEAKEDSAKLFLEQQIKDREEKIVEKDKVLTEKTEELNKVVKDLGEKSKVRDKVLTEISTKSNELKKIEEEIAKKTEADKKDERHLD